MAKRFVDTDLFRKPLMRSLQAPYKVLWVYLLCECDHAGIWDVELDVAGMRLGTKFDHTKCAAAFGDAIVPIDGGRKWWIPEFVSFQYGHLNPANKVHASVLSLLAKHNIDPNEAGAAKPHTSPLEGAKDKAKEEDKDKALDTETEGVQGEPRKGPHPGVQGIVDCLTTGLQERNLAKGLDRDPVTTAKGVKDGNRLAAMTLLTDLQRDYPGFDPLESAKALIGYALQDPFHKSKCTKVRYLANNYNKLIIELKEQKNSPKTQSNDDYQRGILEALARRHAERVAAGNPA